MVVGRLCWLTYDIEQILEDPGYPSVFGSYLHIRSFTIFKWLLGVDRLETRQDRIEEIGILILVGT